MIQRDIYQHYGLYAEELFYVGPYTAFTVKEKDYVLVPDKGHEATEWEEKLTWEQQMKQSGELNSAVFVPTLSREYSAPIDGEWQLLFHIPKLHEDFPYLDSSEEGRQLGEFHHRSLQLFESQPVNTFGERWCQWWVKRIEQLETWYQEIRKKRRLTEMDRWFVQTLPYYIGRTENAIQWIRSSMVNAGHSEQGTICHFCFTSASWVVIRERTPPVKLPSDWVYDHPARDIAEWIRYQLNDFEARDKQKSILQFINSYEERFSLTSFTRNMMFGRLLFPYHYVEQVEQIYLREAPKENGRLNECLQTIWDNEGEQMKQMSYLLKNVVSNNESHEPAWIWTCTE